MTVQPGASVYTQGFGSRPENVEVPVISKTAPPTTNNGNYPVGKRWIDTVANAEYVLTSVASSGGAVTPTWSLLGTATGALNTLSDDSSTLVTPSAGNIQIAGTVDQIATTAGTAEITLSLIGPYTPATYTAHGVLLGEGTSSIVATTAGTNGQLLIGSTGADPAFATLTSSGSTITVTGGANTLNIDVAAPLNVAHGGTGLTTVTAHDLLIGNGTGALTLLAPSATSGVALISQGAASNPAYGTVVVAGGGTGAVTLTGILTGNGTSAVTANAVTQHGVLIGGASNAASSLGVAATGTVLAGSTGADPAFTGSPSVSGSVTAGTGVTATTGDITATAGNLVATAGNLNLNGAASKVNLNVGTAASASAGTATLGAGGTVTVATTAVTASSLIFCSYNNCTSALAAALDAPSGSISAGVHFVINSQDATDATSTVNWWLIN